MKNYNPWHLFVDFLRGLFNSSGTVSSKRFSGVEVLQVVLIMVLGSQFTHYKLDYAVLVSLLSFVLVCFGYNTVLAARAMGVKGNVASDIVDANAPDAAEDAKEVLNSPKP